MDGRTSYVSDKDVYREIDKAILRSSHGGYGTLSEKEELRRQMQDLIKASLRMRPDRIIVGEVRGAEAMSMLQALSTGHSGSVSSIHANSCRDALRRLETMVLMGMDMPLAAIQGLIASSVDILIHLGRLTTGKRKILEICEIKDYSRAEYDIRTLFQYKAGQTESLEMTGKLFHTEKLKSYGQYENYCEAVRLFCEEKREG